MSTQKMSFDIDVEQHRYIKAFCAKIGSSMKEFMLNATLERVKQLEKDKQQKDKENENG